MNKNYCSYCKKKVKNDHWVKESDSRYKTGFRLRCKISKRNAGKRYRDKIKKDPEKIKKQKEYFKKYISAHPEVPRWKSMISSDKKKNFKSSISLELYRLLINDECFYCGKFPANGLDRVNNTLGHKPSNCVPCCEKCNMILGDLPMTVKICLKPGLMKAREKGYIENWTIPTKRRK